MTSQEQPKVRTSATLPRTTTSHAEGDGIRSIYTRGTACKPSLETYASLAIAKGHVTRDMTRWTEIRQQFGRSAKTAPREGRVCIRWILSAAAAFLSHPNA